MSHTDSGVLSAYDGILSVLKVAQGAVVLDFTKETMHGRSSPKIDRALDQLKLTVNSVEVVQNLLDRFHDFCFVEKRNNGKFPDLCFMVEIDQDSYMAAENVGVRHFRGRPLNVLNALNILLATAKRIEKHRGDTDTTTRLPPGAENVVQDFIGYNFAVLSEIHKQEAFPLP